MKKIVVDDNKCIGCGFCFSSSPNFFEMNDEGRAQAKENNLDEIKQNEKEELEDIKDGCPVGAIDIIEK